MPRVSTCLWFERDAEIAVQLYTSLIANSRITATSHYGEGAQMPAGSVMTVNSRSTACRIRR